MGFIGYSSRREADADVVRIFLECRESESNASEVSYTFAVDVIFPMGQATCRIRGVDEVLSLKKFYKLFHSLEERAREHGNPREQVVESAQAMLKHLGYTRNARDFTGLREPTRLLKQRMDR